MKRCCVCHKKATVLINGLWWCDRHVEYTKGELKKVIGTGPELRHINLDLSWI